VSSETGALDDAAVVYPDDATSGLVLTLDVITPIVDDPRAFGEIAAANAISDVYAMGGVPQVALSFIGMPDSVPLDVMALILRGVTEKAHEAQCAIVGGHSIRDSEPKVGLAVVGSVARNQAWTHKRGVAGQKLVLTKALGTGVIAQAARSDQADPTWIARATRSMAELNARGRDAGLRHGVTAATDVTGFGLLGHLAHVAEGSALTARIHTAHVPLLPGALAAAGAGLVPGGSKRNLRYVQERLVGSSEVDPALLTVLADAQTSGGLLLAVDPERADALVEDVGGVSVVVGELVAGEPGQIVLLP